MRHRDAQPNYAFRIPHYALCIEINPDEDDDLDDYSGMDNYSSMYDYDTIDDYDMMDDDF